jgi:hypothetical protein
MPTKTDYVYLKAFQQRLSTPKRRQLLLVKSHVILFVAIHIYISTMQIQTTCVGEYAATSANTVLTSENSVLTQSNNGHRIPGVGKYF